MLQEFHFPAHLKNIGNYAFEDANLDNLILPQELVTIGVNAFNLNSRVEVVAIPASVTTIGSGAFNNMPHIKTVTVERVVPPSLGTNGFNSFTYAAASLQVPLEATHSYKTAPEWSNFQYINDGPTGIVSPDCTDEKSADVEYDLQGRPVNRHTTGIVVNPATRTKRIIR